MGRVDDKMTELADAVRGKNFSYFGNKLSIDDMIKAVGEIWMANDGDTLATAPEDVSAGKKFYVWGNTLLTGTMPDSSPEVNGNSVTIPAGRIREEQTLTVQSGSVSVSGNTVTVTGGYVMDDTLTVQAGSVAISEDKTKVIVTEGYVQAEEIRLPGGASMYKCAAVYGPEKVSGFIVSGAGTAAVNGNYLPTDLKTEEGGIIYKHETAEYYYFEMWGEKGICTSPTGYPSEGIYFKYEWEDGWYVGNGGTEPAPSVQAAEIIINANVPKTWDGYKVQSNSSGSFTMSGTLSTGLTYSKLTPAVGRVYSEDALIKASYFRLSRSGELIVIPMVSDEWKAATGQELVVKGDVELDCEAYRFAHANCGMSAPISDNSYPLTLMSWVKPTANDALLFSLSNGDKHLTFIYMSDNSMRVYTETDDQNVIYNEEIRLGYVRDIWNHFAIVLYADKFKAYVNGKYWGETSLPDSVLNRTYVSCDAHHSYTNGAPGSTHFVKDFRVYSGEKSAADIFSIYSENNPVK